MIKNKLKEIRMKEYMEDNKAEFARKLNVEPHTYAKWENGESMPILSRALEIAQKLNRKVDDIWQL